MIGSTAIKEDQTTDAQGGAEDYFLEGSAPRHHNLACTTINEVPGIG